MIVAELLAKLGLKVDGKSFSAGEKMIGAAKTAIAGLAAYTSINFARGFVQDVADTADHLDELAQKTGVPVESLQQLGYAAGFSGVSIDQLGGSMSTLARTMDRAKRGGKEQSGALRAAGVDMKALRNGTLTLDEAFAQIADKFQKMPDGPAKAALALRVFRGSGRDLIPVLNEGREGIEALRKEFVESGAQMSGDTTEAFAKFNDDQDRLRVTMRGLKVQIVTALLPTLQSLVTRIGAWVKANRQLIIEKITSGLRTMGAVVTTLYHAIAPVVTVLYRFVEASAKALDNIGMLKVILVGAAGAIALSWMAAAFPFVAIGAIIGGLALIVEDLWQAFNGGDSVFRDMYESAREWLHDKLGGILDGIEERLIDLHLIDGKRLVGGKTAFDVERRVMQGEIERGRALPVRRGSSGFVSGKIASLRDEEFEIGATAKRQRFIEGLSRDGGSSMNRRDRLDRNKAVLSQSGFADTLTPYLGPDNVIQSMANLSGASAPTVTIGGITIQAAGADAKEIARKIRDEIDAQIRTLDAASGAKGVP
jgi:hypothetical protein